MHRALILVLVLAAAAGCASPQTSPAVAEFPHRILTASPALLIIEVHHAPGHAPSEEARAHLLATLANVTKKTRIEWSDAENAELNDPGHPWNLTRDLVPLATKLRTHPDDSTQVVLQVLYPGGTHENADATGISLSPGGPSVVFLDALRQNASPGGLIPLPVQTVARLERVTLLHEASHAIGLVNAGLKMRTPHEDAAHRLHSDDPQSVMFWKLDSTNALREIILHDGSVPDSYDANDAADLAAGATP